MTASPTNPMAVTTAWEAWTALWNGELQLAADLVTEDCTVRFGAAVPGGDGLRGPAELARFIADFRALRPGLRYRLDGPAITDGTEAAIRWSARSGTGTPKSGIDVLRLTPDGRIAEVWSVTGERTFPTG
ncbi:nuclear transport factor 2 family protein [Kitasatospora camelliae]|uniref:Nuclear transport factor 2 family protein n=1 Tax=Kitasatospora camelliae TaxID=3156397 RepID=A0AAU8K0T1_9ACTN